jgi:hypothetical protein
MAQSALTVTVANPTPPTNFSFVGNTPPLDPAQPPVDDGAAGSVVVFAAKTAASNTAGAPGAGVSNDHEGKGSEVVVTAPGSSVIAGAETKSFSDMGNYTSTPNSSHASCLSNAVTPTISGVSAGGASGPGTTLLTVTGTNYTRASVVYVDGVAQTTNYVSPTSLTVTNAPKKSSAGNRAVTVSSASVGGTTTAPTNWVFT